jgi:hypothetical protein
LQIIPLFYSHNLLLLHIYNQQSLRTSSFIAISTEKLEQSLRDDSAERRFATEFKTRTSYNSWVSRQESPIIDAIYRRAADLLRIDEALLRDRAEDEFPDLHDKNTIAEDLQMVHYDVMQGESAP